MRCLYLSASHQQLVTLKAEKGRHKEQDKNFFRLMAYPRL